MPAGGIHPKLKPDQGTPVDDKLVAGSISPVPQGTPNDETHVTHALSSSVKRDSSSSSASPKESGTQTPASRSTPPPSSAKRTKPPKLPTTGPQLIGHLPKAEEAARATFVEIPENLYQYGTLGRSREALESMMCDCQYEHGVDNPWVACGEGSECINRLTQVECMPEECRCRGHCKNQRFQRKQYAPIDIVLTEKKGFGLRAAENLSRDTFIYEYVGDVLSSPSMKKRMRDYGKEGIQHFYFMMLQKDEFIDATKKGGIGRFANHSCNPNCYVAKWAIGDRVRMGIFAKRAILKDEELTFNYNVDRYGHEAQQCFCGESNCVGYIGGKTQTDLAAMDDLYIDALGITDEVEKFGLKGNKKRKSKKLDEDYAPVLKPLQDKDVPKVIQAIRQTSSRKVLLKLLTRIKITEDKSPLRQLMRLRGFSLMTNILQDYPSDPGIQILVMECVSTWPLLQRNKIEDSKINVAVQAIADAPISEDETTAADTPIKSDEETPKPQKLKSESPEPSTKTDVDQAQTVNKSENSESVDLLISLEAANGVTPMTVDEPNPQSERTRASERHESQAVKLKRIATKLLEEWATLETGYRIPKRMVVDALDDPVREPTPPVEEERPPKRAKVLEEPTINWLPTPAPPEKAWPPKMPVFVGWNRPQVPEPPKKEAVDAVIAAARAAKVAAALQKAEEEARELAAAEEKAKQIEKKQARKEKEKKNSLSKEEKEALKEKKLKKMVGGVVVKTMSKYQKYMNHDEFKKYAKELTEIIAEKEKKSSSYKEERLDTFSDEKTSKIKKFAKEYIAKVIRKIKEKKKKQQQRQQSASGSGPSSRRESGNGDADADGLDAEGECEEMSAEALESMIAEVGGDDDGDNQDDEGDDMDIDDQKPDVPSPTTVAGVGITAEQITCIQRSSFASSMESIKVLASGLTLEESRAKRQEKQAARYRHRLGTYVPSGDSKGLLEALMATSPRKSPSPKKSIASGSARPRKSVKSSTKGKSNDQTTDESTQEKGEQTKAKKSATRKPTKAADSGKKVTQAESREKKVSRRPVSKSRVNIVEDENENEPKPSTSRQTDKTTNTVKPKATKSSKKSATTKKSKLSIASLRNAEGEDDFDNRPEPAQRKLKKSSAKPPPTHTDDESDDLAIKETKAPKRVDKGKTREIESPPKTFESAGTDVDLEDSRPVPSNMKPLSAEEKSLRDAPPDLYQTIAPPIISRMVSDRGDVSSEERKPPKKRGRPRKDEGEEGRLPKRGKVQEIDDGSEDKGSSKPKPKRRTKESSPKPKLATTKGKTKKKADPPPDTDDEGKEGSILPESEASGSNTRKRQRRTLDNEPYEERDEPDGDESGSNPNRVRLDSIPPEGVIIRRKNGIVERLLPPATKPKRKASDNTRGKTRGSRKRAIPAHVLKYIGPTRIGSPLKAVGTDTDDDLNL